MRRGPDGGPAVAGAVLAAGGGRRLGQVKALVADRGGQPWVRSRVDLLDRAGCAPVLVAVGARAHRVAGCLAGSAARLVPVPQWERGVGASLRALLAAAAALDPVPDALLVSVVDTPGLTAEAVRRVLAGAASPAQDLVQAAYRGRPGHPVLLGRHHWLAVSRSARGDVGARDYLRRMGCRLVECADVADGTDVDTPGQLRRWLHGPVAPW